MRVEVRRSGVEAFALSPGPCPVGGREEITRGITVSDGIGGEKLA